MFDACVDMLGELPSRALKGASVDELRMLIDKYQKQGVAMKDMLK